MDQSVFYLIIPIKFTSKRNSILYQAFVLIYSTKYSTIYHISVMAKREKRIKKLFTNPKAVSFNELDKVLRGFGFKIRQPYSGSSHYIYTKGPLQISVPFKRPYVREVYVKQVLEIIGGINE